MLNVARNDKTYKLSDLTSVPNPEGAALSKKCQLGPRFIFRMARIKSALPEPVCGWLIPRSRDQAGWKIGKESLRL